MRRILALTGALFVLSMAACGDSTEPEQSVAEALTIIGGNFQLDTVTHRLPNPLRVEATDALGLPVEGQLVCYVAATEGAGEPFQPCLETNSEGVGEMPWTLGTVAGDHLAQARAMVNGTPTAVADYVLQAVPGPPVRIQYGNADWSCVGRSLDIRDRVVLAWDQHSNSVPLDTVAAEPDSVVQWTWREGSADLGPSGTGWTQLLPDFGELGYTLRTRTYVDGSTRDYYAPQLGVAVNGGDAASAFTSDVYVSADCPS